MSLPQRPLLSSPRIAWTPTSTRLTVPSTRPNRSTIVPNCSS